MASFHSDRTSYTSIAPVQVPGPSALFALHARARRGQLERRDVGHRSQLVGPHVPRYVPRAGGAVPSRRSRGCAGTGLGGRYVSGLRLDVLTDSAVRSTDRAQLAVPVCRRLHHCVHAIAEDRYHINSLIWPSFSGRMTCRRVENHGNRGDPC